MTEPEGHEHQRRSDDTQAQGPEQVTEISDHSMTDPQNDRDVHHYELWAEAHMLLPWDGDDADDVLSLYLASRLRDDNLGHARIKKIAGVLASAATTRGVTNPRGPRTSSVLAHVQREKGVTAERIKVDGLSSKEVSVVVGALIQQGAPSAAAARRALMLELGHQHRLGVGELAELSDSSRLDDQSLLLKGEPVATETDLSPLRPSHGRLVGSAQQIRVDLGFMSRKVGAFEIQEVPWIGEGCSERQIRLARLAANPHGARALLWTAVYLTGHAWAMRHNDLARLRVEHVEPGSDAVRFDQRGSKTNPTDLVRRAIMHVHAEDTLCCACVLETWTTYRREVDGVTEGALFTLPFGPRSGRGKPITAQASRGVLRRAIGGSPTASKRIGTRSLRIGKATEMSAQGATLPEIMQVTGHKTMSEAVRYIRLVSPEAQPHLHL